MFRAIGKHPLLTVFFIAVVALVAVTARNIMSPEEQSVGRRSSGASPVAVARVVAERLVDELEALGTATANESVDITAKVTETVRTVNFDDGMRVTEGAILVELTNAEERAQLVEYRANLTEAKKQYDRISGLVERGNAAKSTLDGQIALVETTEARIVGVRARLDDRLIRAPFSGVLGFRRVSPGTLVTPNTVIVTLDDIRVIKLDFPVPEAFISAIRPGQAIHASSVAYPDTEFSGVVKTLSPRVDPVTRAAMVRAELPNEEGYLRPGMLLSVRVVRGTRTTLVIPEQALVPVQDRQYVFLIGDDNIAQRKQIEIGRRRPGKVEVLSGLELGDRIVIEGMMNLRPGSKVRVVNTPSSTEPDSDGLASGSQAVGQELH